MSSDRLRQSRARFRCSCQASGRRECTSSLSAVSPRGLASIEDGLRDVRYEIAEADEPREVGWADASLFGQYGKWHAVAADECGSEPLRFAVWRCWLTSSLVGLGGWQDACSLGQPKEPRARPMRSGNPLRDYRQ